MEPTLQTIDDYNKPLKSSKRKTLLLWLVVTLLVVGGASYFLNKPTDTIVTQQNIGQVVYK